jgi:hypothetical protein
LGERASGGYYGIDVEAIVSAFEHRLVFIPADIDQTSITAWRSSRPCIQQTLPLKLQAATEPQLSSIS